MGYEKVFEKFVKPSDPPPTFLMYAPLDNISMPYGPFYSSRFELWPWVGNPTDLFNRLIRNTGHKSTQVITGKLCFFNKNCYTTYVVVT